MSASEDPREDLLIKQLIASVRCAVCQSKYKVEDIQILGHEGEMWLLQVVCSQCKTRGVALAMIKEMDQPSAIYELSPEEMMHFDRLPEIDADEVLDIHEFLHNFEGDVEDLLGTP
jgi:hypothetical protein